ncbi:MAG TPA: hypothetical protein VD735_05665 [Candidatus Saccharimonadales bacterium]|nr:hypothetical protein [Candidatus Saccharimonadales bacterium]
MSDMDNQPGNDLTVTGTNPVEEQPRGIRRRTLAAIAVTCTFLLIVAVLFGPALRDMLGFGSDTNSTSSTQIADDSRPIPDSLLDSESAEPAPGQAASPTGKNIKCGQKPTLDVKVADPYVNGQIGPTFTVKTCLPSGYTVYAFDEDSDDNRYYLATVEDSNTFGPIITSSGNHIFNEPNIGDPGDLDKLTVVHFVLASPSCEQRLKGLEGTRDGSHVYTREAIFGNGSCVDAQKVNVYVTNK